jgi:uncharacterized protein
MAMGEMERRCVAVGELRAERFTTENAETRKIGGYAALFGSLSEEMWGFREEIAPGAFARTLQDGADVRALFNHDANLVLGRTTAGTLRLQEDDRGLAFEIDLPETGYAADLWRLIDRGDVSQMSFGFRTVTDEWRMQDGTPLRTLQDVELYDVSPVTYPAYAATSVDVRSRVEELLTTDASSGEEGTEGTEGAQRGAPVSVLVRRLRVAEVEV